MWEPEQIHCALLGGLLDRVPLEDGALILDAGSGRTSLRVLTRTFPDARITALIHPLDARKRDGIHRSIGTEGYHLTEADLQEFRAPTRFDLVLAHLLLGEAEKFGAGFDALLTALFDIPTRHLAIVDILEDPAVNFRGLIRRIATTRVRHVAVRGDYVGFLLERSDPELDAS
jgi:trans-aconitate methyltransferase